MDTQQLVQKWGSSPVEILPKELTWKIMEYATEKVADLRLTSQTLLCRVNEYALLADNNILVKKLKISSTGPALYRSKVYPIKILCLMLYIPLNKTKLFELRLKLRNSLLRLRLHIDGYVHTFTGQAQFVLKLSVDGQSGMTFLRECMGRHIGTVHLNECCDQIEWNVVSRLLEGTKIGAVKYTIASLCDTLFDHLLNIIKVHKVDDLILELRHNNNSNHAQVLYDLSSVVRSLEILQLMHHRDIRRNFFFGSYDLDWASIILEMFSRKIDKLSINNRYYPHYLDSRSVDLLSEHLPNLGKKVWFSASCAAYPGELDLIANEHSVHMFVVISKEEMYHELTVKHCLRSNEVFEHIM